MKNLDFRSVTLHEAFQIRLEETDGLVYKIEHKLRNLYAQLNRDVNQGTNVLNWGDLGSLAHAVEQLEEAAMALGIEVENYDG